jgi:V8-like Glu-specific endopeptidase
MFRVGLALVLLVGAGAQRAVAQQVTIVGSTTAYTVGTTSAYSVDFVNARPMPLPRSSVLGRQAASAVLPPASTGAPGVSPGATGTGVTNEVFLGTPVHNLDGGVESQEFGTFEHPFSTARSDLRTPTAVPTNIYYPYRATGKLFFTIPGQGSFVCSASLIKRGLVVTAAHCVAAFGAQSFYTDWQFVPGYRNGSAPFGVWTFYQVWIRTGYYNGSAPCAVAGIVCTNDMAVATLNEQSGTLPGTSTGYYGYAWDGYGFVNSLTQITQVGYPVCLDNGALQQRNDSYGYVDAALSNNTVIGTLMCGGSSGGPWLVNFGVRPTLTGTSAGSAPDPNIVVGVTSWGYVDSGPKEAGASPFWSTNIVSLVTQACGSAPSPNSCL